MNMMQCLRQAAEFLQEPPTLKGMHAKTSCAQAICQGSDGQSCLGWCRTIEQAMSHLQPSKQEEGPQPELSEEREDELEAEGEACLRQLQHPLASADRLRDQLAPEPVQPPSLKDLLQVCSWCK